MSSSGAAATSAAAATSSRGGGIPAAVPAAELTGGTHVSGSVVRPPAKWVRRLRHPHPTLPFFSDEEGAATGELLATKQEQEQLTGGTHVSGSGVGTPAVVGASPTPPASDPSAGAVAATGERLATEQEQEQLSGGTNESGSGVGPPAVVGASPTPPASDPSVGAGAATGELLGTEQEHWQLVASGGRREVLAQVSRSGGGTSPVSLGVLPAASPAPPGPPPT